MNDKDFYDFDKLSTIPPERAVLHRLLERNNPKQNCDCCLCWDDLVNKVFNEVFSEVYEPNNSDEDSGVITLTGKDFSFNKVLGC